MERFKSNGGEHVNAAYDPTLDEPPLYEDHRMVRPSVVSAFGHDTLDRVPNIDFYRNAGSMSGHRAIRPSLQELHDVFQKVSVCDWPSSLSQRWFLLSYYACLSSVSPSVECSTPVLFLSLSQIQACDSVNALIWDSKGNEMFLQLQYHVESSGSN